jgi:formate hydrogenlyase subunit 3/multisubunit Na+/H+ antiporter MnhD subunit
MFATAVVTQDHRRDPLGHRLRWLLSDVGPWLWCVAGIACFVLADRLSGWPSLIPVTVGLACGLYGLTSFNHGHDGLSKYRQ